MPDDASQTVLGNIDREAMLTLAQDLIKIPSFKTEETAVARYLGDYFRQAAMRCNSRKLNRAASRPSPSSKAAAVANL